MSSNVGLSTPRGSGTSGYVQRNLSNLKPRDTPYSSDPSKIQQHRQRQPDADILEHDRRRAIELRIFELRDSLEEEGKKTDDEIDEECDALREKLEKEHAQGKDGKGAAKGLKSHQVHELARAKIEESEKLRRALGIRDDYEEGSHWKRQEEKQREVMAKAVKESVRRRDDSEDDE